MKNFWILKLNRIIGLCALFCGGTASAQFSEPDFNLPHNEEYQYPIKPGSLGSLAGNMGELRSNHFHSGLDIRTNNESGYDVHAAKSGYVSRIGVSSSGYGNVIYVTHPDGNTSLYAHLHNFVEPIKSRVLEEQYRLKKFDLDLHFNPGEYLVKQGDVIGISGNSGSSGGPHLHFDIRDKNDHALDPLQYGFNEIVDNTPPIVQKIALITLDKKARINGQFGRFEFYATKVGSQYVIKSPLRASGTIGLEVKAIDKFIPKGKFYGGVKFIDLYVNEKKIFNQGINIIDTDETRMIHTFIDYKHYQQHGSRFYKLYIDDGNGLPFYENSPTRGKIHINPDIVNKIDIALRDKFGNEAKANLLVSPDPPTDQVKGVISVNAIQAEKFENILKVTTKKCLDHQYLSLYIDGTPVLIKADYVGYNTAIYLIDLRDYLPDSVSTCQESLVTNLADRIPATTEYTYYGDWVDIRFPQSALYDTLYLDLSRDTASYPEVFSIGDHTIPLHRYIRVSIKPTKEYQFDEKTAMYKINKRSFSYYGGEWQNGRFHFSTRNFGDYTLLRDTIPPTIQARSLNQTMLRFRIDDDLSGIDTYEATLNGEWLLMNYDKKYHTIWSEPKANMALQGNFVLTVTDHAGNTQTFSHHIP